MNEYKIVVTDYCNNEDLVKELNKYGAQGWDVFSVVGYDVSREEDELKTEYTLIMKRQKVSFGL